MSLTTIPSDATVEEAIGVVDRDGGVIIRDYVSTEVLEGLEADLRPHLSGHAFGVDDYFAGRKTKRLGALFKRSKHCETVALQPLYQALAKHYLCRSEFSYSGEEKLETVSSYQIGAGTAIEIHPGQGAQPIHRDDMTWHWRHPEGHRQARVQVMFALSDFTAENGGTLVIPGSHLWDDERAPKREEAVSTEMPAGSALIWLGSTFHAGGKNVSDGPRTGLTFTMDLGFLRQDENQAELEAVDPEPDRELLPSVSHPAEVRFRLRVDRGLRIV